MTVPAVARATNWEFIGSSSQAQEIAVDMSSMRVLSAGTIKVAVRLVPPTELAREYSRKMIAENGISSPPEPREEAAAADPLRGYVNYKYTVRYYEVDCITRQARITAVADYDRGDDLLQMLPDSEAKWESLGRSGIPLALFEMFHDAVKGETDQALADKESSAAGNYVVGNVIK
ncbi:MAG: hypothetical protein V2A77_02680 [Pseudomonadota bacterium]